MAFAYQTVADEILQRIRGGVWAPGSQLPPLNDLEKLFPQSRMTLYKALRDLTDRGYLVMDRGRGTFVRSVESRPRIGVMLNPLIFEHGVAPFFFQAFRRAHAYLVKKEKDPQLFTEYPGSDGLPVGLWYHLDKSRLEGLLLIGSHLPCNWPQSDEWRRRAVPYVAIAAAASPHAVFVDSRAFICQALNVVVASDRKKAALLQRHEHLTENVGFFINECQARGVEFCEPPTPMPPSTLSYEEYGYELLQRFWAKGSDRPNTVVVPDDVIAKGVVQGALALGIKVPDQLLIVVMTNRGARFFYPLPVTALEVDVEAVVSLAVNMLLDMIAGVDVPPQTILVPPVVGRTTSANRPVIEQTPA